MTRERILTVMTLALRAGEIMLESAVSRCSPRRSGASSTPTVSRTCARWW
ncbi:MAG: hypothetical protein U5R31_11545 [Acidimicrobiia bacterium]|nr:hypothetical protein [Acidimicrobiia bacterium]